MSRYLYPEVFLPNCLIPINFFVFLILLIRYRYRGYANVELTGEANQVCNDDDGTRTTKYTCRPQVKRFGQSDSGVNEQRGSPDRYKGAHAWSPSFSRISRTPSSARGWFPGAFRSCTPGPVCAEVLNHCTTQSNVQFELLINGNSCSFEDLSRLRHNFMLTPWKYYTHRKDFEIGDLFCCSFVTDT